MADDMDPVSAVDRAFQDVIALATESNALPPGHEGLTSAVLYDREALRNAYVSLAHVLVSAMDPQNASVSGSSIDFELCQACFVAIVRVLVAVGSSDTAVEETTVLLESVHEVYDVVLTCAETYEWAQPGATGALRLYMLQVLAVAFGYDKITGRSLMELLSNDTTAAISLLTYILRCRDPDCQFELQDLASRCLVELTTADSVFLPDGEGGGDTNDQRIASLTKLLNTHTNGIIQGIVQFDAVDAFGRCICQWQESHAKTDILVQAFLGLIHNSLLYCSANQKHLRSHLSLRSTIVQDIMLPYVENILPALYEAPVVKHDMIEFKNLTATIQTFVIVTFNMNLFRTQFLHSDILIRCMQVPTAMQSFRMLECMIKLHVNIDFATSAYFERSRDLLHEAVNNLAPAARARLAARLRKPSHSLPISMANPISTEQLNIAFNPEGFDASALDLAEPVDGEEEADGGFFGMRWDGVGEPLGVDGGAAADYASAGYQPLPDHAQCELSGALMSDPFVTPEGHYYDRPALEQWVATHGTDPMTGSELHLMQCQPAGEVQATIAEFQAASIAKQVIDAPGAERAAPAVNNGLLGDLPSLEKSGAPASPEKGSKKKIKIRRNLVQDCPDEFRCMIDHKILTKPMRTAEGHVFEEKTLEQWMTSCGSVNPITQAPLTMDMCTVDKELQKKIVKWFKETNA
jgi:hypothetical protein